MADLKRLEELMEALKGGKPKFQDGEASVDSLGQNMAAIQQAADEQEQERIRQEAEAARALVEAQPKDETDANPTTEDPNKYTPTKTAQWSDAAVAIANVLNSHYGKPQINIPSAVEAERENFKLNAALKPKAEKTTWTLNEKQGKYVGMKPDGNVEVRDIPRWKLPEMSEIEKAELALKQAQIAKTLREANKPEDVKAPAAEKPTVGQASADRTFGKEYDAWTSGGAASVDKNIQVLENAKKNLEKFSTILPPRIEGNLPDALRSEESRVIQQDVQSTAVTALREILGAQFTEKEGERIKDYSYDPKLLPKENIKKLDRALQELKAKKAAKDAKAAYFEQTGTLKGFKSQEVAPEKTPSLDEKVTVVNPEGKRGKIKKSQLDAALKQGYKLAE